MSTPTTRRYFLNRFLAALAVAPLVAKAAFARQPLPTLKSTAWSVQFKEDRNLILDVQGAAIKVPSNRVAMGQWAPEYGISREWHQYEGPWDGTFKLERGCANPAYILADLYERAGGPDWVTEQWRGQQFRIDGATLVNWQMLYDWGRHCDEMVLDTSACGAMSHKTSAKLAPRFTVNTVCTTQEEIDQLRETLRMHCLRWQSTDPRYRTSWPGIPYSEGAA